MSEQNYKNHVQMVPLYHYVLGPILLLTFIGSLVNLYKSLDDHVRIYSASLIAVLSLGSILLYLFARIFALKAQDRAIVAQENFRHYLLTGKPLDGRLTVRQTIGLRFASDAEFPALATRAASEGMSESAIKQAVKNWRADTYRA